MRLLIRIFAFGMSIRKDGEAHKIYVAIVGAGNVGVSLAEELLNNKIHHILPYAFLIQIRTKPAGIFTGYLFFRRN